MNKEYIEARINYHNAREWFFIKARLHKIDDRTIQAYKKASDNFFNYLQSKLEEKIDG